MFSMSVVALCTGTIFINRRHERHKVEWPTLDSTGSTQSTSVFSCVFVMDIPGTWDVDGVSVPGTRVQQYDGDDI